MEFLTNTLTPEEQQSFINEARKTTAFQQARLAYEVKMTKDFQNRQAAIELSLRSFSGWSTSMMGNGPTTEVIIKRAEEFLKFLVSPSDES